ncbi:MAG: hypothetical protein K6B14_10170 [Lachnospiraceae bacterium]|nr:hypothetical protein [Lachnospiraceae bacterium]
MRDILKLRLKRLGALLLATGVMITAVGCAGGGGSSQVTEDSGPVAADSAEATTIQISKYVGGVSLKESGVETAVRENMHLHNDNVLETAADGSVDLLLDDTKMVGLDVSSVASFVQEGKKLSCNVEKGAIYFYTTDKVAEDETFAISSSTMMVGIRGTSGYVLFNEKTGVAKIVLTSGKVHLIATNPVTGGTNEADLDAGESAQVTLFDFMEGSDSVRFEFAKVTPADLPPILVKKIVDDPTVFAEVVDATGWDDKEMTTIAESVNCVIATDPQSTQFAADSGAALSDNLSSMDTVYDSAKAAADAGVQVDGENGVIRTDENAGTDQGAGAADDANLTAATDNVLPDAPADQPQVNENEQQQQEQQQDQGNKDKSDSGNKKEDKGKSDNKDKKDDKDKSDNKDKNDSQDNKNKTENKKTTSTGGSSGSSGRSSGSSGSSSDNNSGGSSSGGSSNDQSGGGGSSGGSGTDSGTSEAEAETDVPNADGTYNVTLVGSSQGSLFYGTDPNSLSETGTASPGQQVFIRVVKENNYEVELSSNPGISGGFTFANCGQGYEIYCFTMPARHVTVTGQFSQRGSSSAYGVAFVGVPNEFFEYYTYELSSRRAVPGTVITVRAIKKAGFTNYPPYKPTGQYYGSSGTATALTQINPDGEGIWRFTMPAGNVILGWAHYTVTLDNSLTGIVSLSSGNSYCEGQTVHVVSTGTNTSISCLYATTTGTNGSEEFYKVILPTVPSGGQMPPGSVTGMSFDMPSSNVKLYGTDPRASELSPLYTPGCSLNCIIEGMPEAEYTYFRACIVNGQQHGYDYDDDDEWWDEIIVRPGYVVSLVSDYDMDVNATTTTPSASVIQATHSVKYTSAGGWRNSYVYTVTVPELSNDTESFGITFVPKTYDVTINLGSGCYVGSINGEELDDPDSQDSTIVLHDVVNGSWLEVVVYGVETQMIYFKVDDGEWQDDELTDDGFIIGALIKNSDVTINVSASPPNG